MEGGEEAGGSKRPEVKRELIKWAYIQTNVAHCDSKELTGVAKSQLTCPSN